MRGSVFSVAFWRDAIERAASTAGQAVLIVWSLDGVDQIADVEVDLSTFLSAAGFGALYAFLKSVAASFVGDKDSASLDPHVGTVLLP